MRIACASRARSGPSSVERAVQARRADRRERKVRDAPVVRRRPPRDEARLLGALHELGDGALREREPLDEAG